MLGGGCVCATSNCVGFHCGFQSGGLGLQPIASRLWWLVGLGAERRPEALVRRSALVEFRGVVVCVTEQTVDGVEATAGVGETFDDPCDTDGRVGSGVVSEVVEAGVGVDENSSKRVDRPGEFAGRADHARQIRRQHVVVVTKIITRGFQCADRGVDESDGAVHDRSVPVREWFGARRRTNCSAGDGTAAVGGVAGAGVAGSGCRRFSC